MKAMNQKKLLAGAFLFFTAMFICHVYGAESDAEAKPLRLKEFKVDRKVSAEARGCIDCHAVESRGIVADWADSRHAHATEQHLRQDQIFFGCVLAGAYSRNTLADLSR